MRAQGGATAGDGSRTVWDGVYTEAQAARGERRYGEACESCHQAGLDGDAVAEVPSLVFDAFTARWSGKSVGELLEETARAMPKDAPGSLERRAYADLVAFILSRNAFPAGRTPLDADPERSRAIRIEKIRTPAR